MDGPCYCIWMPDIPDQLDVDMIQGLILAGDALGQDVVYEPGQVDIFLLLLLLPRPRRGTLGG